ncbi:MAG TPA: YSC84-related protein [Casimicrobiaceae bacterium]|nr:YSC84-related protein [Casimicrobiaceae bacterium]
MLKRLISISAVLMLGLTASFAWADSCTDTANLFRKAGQSAGFFKTAYGYAVFPTIGKGGIGVGGAYGKGCVYAKGKHVGDTSMTQLSIGFQLGGQGFSEIIFFQDERSFREFAGGNFEFGADATAVAITAAAGAGASSTGASAGASISKNDASTGGGAYYKGMATFYIIKGGLMYEAAVKGQKFSYKAR